MSQSVRQSVCQSVRKTSLFGSVVQRIFKILLYSLFALTTTISVAQTSIDLDPPQIDHSVPSAVKPGKAVKISALVTDDSGIESVTLYYRTTQTGPYETAEMQSSEGGAYAAFVVTSKNKESLQYYIEAVDNGGNRVIEGGPGSPLVVQTVKKSNMLLIAAGAILAIGLAAGGGGGSKTSTSRDLIIQVDTPSP